MENIIDQNNNLWSVIVDNNKITIKTKNICQPTRNYLVDNLILNGQGLIYKNINFTKTEMVFELKKFEDFVSNHNHNIDGYIIKSANFQTPSIDIILKNISYIIKDFDIDFAC